MTMMLMKNNDAAAAAADDDDDNDDGSGADDGDGKRSEKALRSSYVGRGNVQAVRAARKRAGLSDSFGRSDPLLQEFATYLGASENDIANKVNLDSMSILISV